MLYSITINKEIYTFKPTQVGIRLCQCQFKAISKSSDTAVHIFYYIMCQIHIFQKLEWLLRIIISPQIYNIKSKRQNLFKKKWLTTRLVRIANHSLYVFFEF